MPDIGSISVAVTGLKMAMDMAKIEGEMLKFERGK